MMAPDRDLQRVELALTGLASEATDSSRAARLEHLPGIVSILLNPVTERAVVLFDPATIGVDRIVGAFEAEGLATAHTIARWHLRVEGLECAGCVPRLEEAVGKAPGVLAAIANPATGSLTVEYLPGQVDLEAVREAVTAQGCRLTPDTAAPYRSPDATGDRFRIR